MIEFETKFFYGILLLVISWSRFSLWTLVFVVNFLTFGDEANILYHKEEEKPSMHFIYKILCQIYLVFISKNNIIIFLSIVQNILKILI